MEDKDISFYNEEVVSESLENDEISPEEEGFMKGYADSDEYTEEEDEDGLSREKESV